jgi:transposase
MEPQPAGVLASRFGVRPQTVRNLLTAYRQRGPAGVETAGRGQRQRAYLSLERERKLLESFYPEGVAGHVSTGRGVKAALEQEVGHAVAKSTVYRLMKRHQWRKGYRGLDTLRARRRSKRRLKKLPPGSSGSPGYPSPCRSTSGVAHGRR